MLQLENTITELGFSPGFGCLVGAFPDGDDRFDLSGYCVGKVCVFLNALPAAGSLPAQGQAAGLLERMLDQVLAGNITFSLSLTPSEQEAIRRLAGVFVEVVIDDVCKSFPILTVMKRTRDGLELQVTEGFCDLVLGRWERWSAGADDCSGPRLDAENVLVDAAMWNNLATLSA